MVWWFLTRATDPVEKVAIVLWFSSNLTKGEAMEQAARIMAGMTP
jgi:hypothetical protein